MEHKKEIPAERRLNAGEVLALIESRPGDLFCLDYVKANGECKRINAQWGVNGKAESRLPYDPAKGGNIVLFDCNMAQCKTIKLANVAGVSYGDGVKYVGPAAGAVATGKGE